MAKSEATLLSAIWINERIKNVLDQAEAIIKHLLEDGLLASGYAPLEEPLTAADIKRMTPDQLLALLASLQDPGQRLAVLSALDIPLDEIYALMEGPEQVAPEGVE